MNPLSPGRVLAQQLSLSAAAREFVDQQSQLVQLHKGGLALIKGDPVAGAYIVTGGCLRVFSYTPQGAESTLYLINAGETCVFAINCLFKQLLYPAWVRADEDTELVVIRGEAFRKLFASESSVQDLTINALSTAVFRLIDQVERVQGWSLRQRLAHLLLNRACEERVLRMTQQEIANQLGSSREVIARLLGEMNAKGWISTGRGRVLLNHPAALSALLSGEG